MGIFTKKSGDREAILKRVVLAQPSGESNRVSLKSSSSSSGNSARGNNEDENSITTVNSAPRKTKYRLRRNFFNRTSACKKTNFHKLYDEGPSPKNLYEPPAVFKDSTPSAFTAHSPVVVVDGNKATSCQKMKKKLNGQSAPRRHVKEFQRVESIESKATDDSSLNEYEPPKFELHGIKAVAQPTYDRTSSEWSFDVRSNARTITSNDQLRQKRSVSSVSSTGRATKRQQQPEHQPPRQLPDQEQGNEFRQFVFDPNFKTIEKVAVERSDPGTSDFSDFVQAAAKLNQSLSEECSRIMVNRATQPSSTPAKSRLEPYTPLRPPTPPPLPPPSDCQTRGSMASNTTGSSFPVFSTQNLALSQESYIPPKSNATSESVVSNVSLANATVRSSTLNAYPKPEFRSVSAESTHSDPFKDDGWLYEDDSAWIPVPPKLQAFPSFPPVENSGNKQDAAWMPPPKSRKKNTHVANDALIHSIRRASSRDKDCNSAKPDPSPRGSSDNGAMDLWSRTGSSFQPEEVQKTSSDSILEVSGRKRKDTTVGSKTSSRSSGDSSVTGPQRKPPKGVPNNAILGSMLFRHTFSDEASSTQDSKEKGNLDENRSHSDGSNSHNDQDDYDDDDVENDASYSNYKVPPNILTDDKSSAVSTVTEETGSTYHPHTRKSDSAWNKQAQHALSQWRKAKEEFRGLTSYHIHTIHRTEPPSLMDLIADDEHRNSTTAETENMFSA